ncbi:MAG: ABC transporter substrate-binding protein [Thermoactinospora sp.]|nr:ABC transporter substrate-binding protein [Thermoactinospora sp.]
MKKTLAVPIALTLASAAACYGGGKDRITIACGAHEQWCATMTRRFAEQTGIEADFVRLSSGEALARIKAARGKPEFDAWHGGPADGYEAAKKEGLLEPYLSPEAARIKPQWRDPGGAWTGVYLGVLGFCNNPDVLAETGLEPVTSWRALLDERLRKNVGVAHPATSGTGYTVMWTQVALGGGDQDAGLDYLRRLHPNVLQFNKSGNAAAQQAGRGEVGVGVVFSHDCVAQQQQGYTKLRVTFPEEGTGYEIGAVAVIKGARNAQGARAYVDWALSAESQRLGPTVGFYALPTNAAVTPDSKAADLSKITLVDYDVPGAGQAKPGLVRRFEDEIMAAS